MCFQARLHQRELGAVLGEEPAEARRVGGRELGDLLFHPRDVRCAIHFAARAEDDAILRIKPDHFNFAAQFRAADPENFLEHARVEKKSRAEIKLVAVRLDAGGASADDGQALDDL